jgi:hypothetical protein
MLCAWARFARFPLLIKRTRSKLSYHIGNFCNWRQRACKTWNHCLVGNEVHNEGKCCSSFSFPIFGMSWNNTQEISRQTKPSQSYPNGPLPSVWLGNLRPPPFVDLRQAGWLVALLRDLGVFPMQWTHSQTGLHITRFFQMGDGANRCIPQTAAFSMQLRLVVTTIFMPQWLYTLQGSSSWQAGKRHVLEQVSIMSTLCRKIS